MSGELAELDGRRIVVGVAGGIAAYKGAELVRLLVKAGATVQVVTTRGAEQFITRLTLQTLSGRPVASELFDLDAESQIGHIRIADEAELIVLAPATAHLIARLAAGLADDLLTTVVLATHAPLLIAPAMNVNMWGHPQTQANMARLVERGAHVVGPASGELACGWQGSGRLVDPEAIALAAARALGPRDLDRRTLLVTAGPTQEPIDPVRFLGNRSSGKMGFAIAGRAAARGARVQLVAGPVELATPRGVERIDVATASEMREAVLEREEAAGAVIMAAAVADFRAKEVAPRKLKKGAGAPTAIALERNPDILAELAERRRARGRGPLLVGFAAETPEGAGGLERLARETLEKKGCDLIVANDVAEPGSGFGSDENRVVVVARDQPAVELGRAPKGQIADQLLDRIAPLLR
jgi:phosphopantothenoylcysteine decarboxylase/phosphopantothenate--cysteine ligase